MAKAKVLPKRRFGVMYYFDSRKEKYPNAWGSTETFASACGNAARHVARSDFFGSEYRKAVIWDKYDQRIVRVYSRTSDGISIREPKYDE
jgi:hypothetical protein